MIAEDRAMKARPMRANARTSATGSGSSRAARTSGRSPKGNGLVVTAEGDIKNGLEQRPLGGEQAVQGGQRGVGGAGDRLEGGGGIAVLDEQGLGCLDDPQPGGPDLGLAAGVVVGPLDGAGHIRDTTTLMARVSLSRI